LGRVYSWKSGYLHGFDRSVRNLSGYTVTKQVLTSSCSVENLLSRSRGSE
jgi:hypothetical protein